MQITIRWKIAQWFELKWWQNYLSTKDIEAYKSWKKNYWRNVIEQVKDEVKVTDDSTLADIGCGPSGVFMIFNNHKITAADPLIDAYEKQTALFKKSDYPHVDFVNTAVEDFNPTTKFDFVFCMNAINHFKDMPKAFEKLKALCGKDGVLVLSIDAHNHSFFKHLFRLLPGDILHPHQYDLKEYTGFLSSGGWQVRNSALLKREFFFNHYVLVASRLSSL